jgi:hypothetical protein
VVGIPKDLPKDLIDEKKRVLIGCLTNNYNIIIDES